MNHKRSAAVCLFALLLVWGIHYLANHLPISGIKGHTIPATQGPSAIVRSLRPNYPYSIIPGGAYSPRELQFAHSQDDVVRAHYADFNVKNAKLVTLTDDRYEYVSYRLRDQVYWTKRKLRIPKGELLLTDGESYARARCGNRLSDQPHRAATNAHEPEDALSMPPADSESIPKMAFTNGPALGDIPAGTASLPAQTGAALPAGNASIPPPTQSLILPGATEPEWVGQPAIPGAAPGSGLIPAVGRSNASPTSINQLLPAPPSPPSAQPLLPPSAQPLLPTSEPAPTVEPVPEPNSIYLFVCSLAISVLVLLRMSRKSESS